MPIVFEEVTGEVESRRDDAAAESHGAANDGPSKDEIWQLVAEHAHIMTQRCLRSFAD